MLRACRWLQAAKTAVKEPVKKAVAKKEKVKAVKKVIDWSQWQHSRWEGNNLPQLINGLPKPKLAEHAHSKTWLHKNGYGLKFYRELWARYPEPCYWTVVKYKPRAPHGGHVSAWGFRTWRGVTEPIPRKIPAMYKKEWRILIEPGTQLGSSTAPEDIWTAPPITASSLPVESVQLPNRGLKGIAAGTWPYPWGELGYRKNPQPKMFEAAAKPAEAAATATDATTEAATPAAAAAATPL